MAAHFRILLFATFLFLSSVVTQPGPRLSYRTEWRALMDLRSSLGVSAKDWHKKANPCLNWTGIECENGHIAGINLSGLRRTREGKLNPRFAIDSLPNFTYLSSFNSSGFSLRGSIPEWFGQRLSNLEVVDLRSSSIIGSIPSSIGGLSRLSSLYLSDNSITGNMPTELEKLVSLLVLDFSQNLLTGQIPMEISALRNLNKLDLSSNFLSGGIPTEFGSFSSLELLNLSNNSLSGPIPSQLGNISQLVELDLGYNSFVGSLPGKIGELKSLRKMSIVNNKLEGSLSNNLFRKLAHLEFLDVSGNNLTGVLSNVSTYSNVAGSVFNFSNNMFYGILNSGIGNFRVVDLSGNYFEGSAPNDSRIIITNNCFSSVRTQRRIETCRKFYSDRGLSLGNNSGLGPPLTQRPNGVKRLAYVMIGVFGGLGFVIVLTGTFLLLRACSCISSSPNHQRRNSNVSPIGSKPKPKVLVDLSSVGESFTYEQMLVATGNFGTENLIKQGHSGDLFKGTLESGGPTVVIKRVDLRCVRNESFMLELDLFSKVIMHPRVVPLVGHCLEDEYVKFLPYKHMPNGDLSNALYRLMDGDEDLLSLDWITRLKIAIGAAEALSYLHHECTPPVVHRDIQASSILLDDKYEVRLGSLSEVCAPGANNHQNMIARLLRTPQNSGRRHSGSPSASCSYDVYSFGKVLLELVTGKLGISSLTDTGAKQWLDSNLPFISIHDKELVTKIVDQSLIIDEDLLEEVWAVSIVAKSCLNPKASRRPSMRHVLKALENPFKVVRDENFSSGRLRAGSSRQSWTAAIFGSWRRSSSESSNASSRTNREIIGGLRQIGSRGSGAHDYSSSQKRSSSDVFPEPVELQDVDGV